MTTLRRILQATADPEDMVPPPPPPPPSGVEESDDSQQAVDGDEMAEKEQKSSTINEISKASEEAIKAEEEQDKILKKNIAVKADPKPAIPPPKITTDEPEPPSTPKPNMQEKEAGKTQMDDSPEDEDTAPPPPPSPTASPGPPRSTRGAGREEDQSAKDEDAVIKWVQCERCNKWRDLPSSLNHSLPDIWWCSMNTWEPMYASCDVPQKETQEEDDSVANTVVIETEKSVMDTASPGNTTMSNGKKKKKQKVATEAEATKPREKTGSRRAGKKAGSGGPKSTKPKRGDGAKANLRPSISNMMNGNSNNGSGKEKAEWVMCETCQQWRKLPPDVNVDDLPEKWYCHMNKWDKLRASCSAPEEVDDGGVEQEALLAGGTRVKLPDGVKLYGGQFFSLKGGRKNLSLNFRELIVHHVRTNFTKYDSTMNTFLGDRYRESSLFVPRGPSKPKTHYKKLLASDSAQWAESSDISQSTRSSLGIFKSATEPLTSFRKVFDIPPASYVPMTTKRKLNEIQNPPQTPELPIKRIASPEKVIENADNHTTTKVPTALDFIKDEYRVPRALLKFSKPWKRAGGWVEYETSTTQNSLEAS